jgi:hypothetical protein
MGSSENREIQIALSPSVWNVYLSGASKISVLGDAEGWFSGREMR